MKEHKKLMQCKLNVTTELVRTPVDTTIPRLIADLDIIAIPGYNETAYNETAYNEHLYYPNCNPYSLRFFM